MPGWKTKFKEAISTSKTKLKQTWFKCKRIITRQKKAFDLQIAPLKKLDYRRGFNIAMTLGGLAINVAVYTGIVWMWNTIGMAIFSHPLSVQLLNPMISGLFTSTLFVFGASVFTAGLVFATATKTLGEGNTRLQQVLGVLNSALPFVPFLIFPLTYGALGAGQTAAMVLSSITAAATALWIGVTSDKNLGMAFMPTIAPPVRHKPAKEKELLKNKKLPKPTTKSTKPAILNQYKNKKKTPTPKRPAPKGRKPIQKKKVRRAR